MFTLISFLAICLLKLFFYLLLLFAAFVLLSKVFVEPVKGVCKCTAQLNGKVALVTGGNSGIGLETARDLARKGARVIIACRDARKSQEAVEDIIRTTGNPNVEFRYLDLFKPSCIRTFAEDFNRTVDCLNILVNNAGCAGAAERLAENGVEITMQVNHIGHFLLTNLLLDKLEASRPSRIVIVSSKLYYFAKLNVDNLAGVKANQHSMIRYANSKLCNVLWARALARRLPKGVTVNSLHPGLVMTDIFKRLLDPVSLKILHFLISLLFKTAWEGAQTSIHLCVAPELEMSSGGYYAECRLRDYYRIAQDERLVERVWEESKRLAEKC